MTQDVHDAPGVRDGRGVQYGTAVASVYDSLIAPAMPAEVAVDRLRPYVAGARVLEVGVGTGRVAVPVAALAREVVGVDNSRPMLAEFRAKGVPANVSLVEADFRRPLPLQGRFGAAYSTMGSLACVHSREELTAALAHVREVLEPGATLSLEYYSTAVYRPLVELGTVTVPMPHHGGTTTFTTTVDDADVLTMGTLVEKDGEAPVEFAEQVLLIERDEVEACLVRAGFAVQEVVPAEELLPYDWYTARGVA
ncbi:class I SAM-dependent DNA methyltransferase [Streptomyces radiopugnans]|uniref:Methyltransferase domain-containing protein n=1 Tax=Streptomyces radiopugnans TaxID=403935 RepID=A0A1H9EPH4_9ACTN|nr:class I SAM-dependent methyltransferase [Streptomyces radiopugnans]SEQ27525.1 Methyltransferase domain-containing protein [Streptomyces radiopugnans]